MKNTDYKRNEQGAGIYKTCREKDKYEDRMHPSRSTCVQIERVHSNLYIFSLLRKYVESQYSIITPVSFIVHNQISYIYLGMHGVCTN